MRRKSKLLRFKRNGKESDNKENKIWKQKLENKNVTINDSIEGFKKEIVNKMNDPDEDKYSYSRKLKEAVSTEFKEGNEETEKQGEKK